MPAEDWVKYGGARRIIYLSPSPGPFLLLGILCMLQPGGKHRETVSGGYSLEPANGLRQQLLSDGKGVNAL